MSELAETIKTTPPRRTVESAIIQQTDGLAAALAGRIGTDRFVRAAVTAFKTTPALQNCSWESVLGGLFVAAQLGLEVGGPRALCDLVPYGKEATLVVGYRGYAELFYRAGASKVEWFIIREGDHFKKGANSRDGKFYEWDPQDNDSSREYIGAVAQVKLANGDIQFEHMTREEIEQRRPRNWERTPWKQWPEPMGLKTVLRSLAKTVRQSTDELALASNTDGAVITRIEGVEQSSVEHPPTVGAPNEPEVQSIAGVHDLVVTRDDDPVVDDASPDYVAPKVDQ